MARHIVKNNERILLMKDMPRKIKNGQGGLDYDVYWWCWENGITYKKIYIKIEDKRESDTVILSNLNFAHLCKGIEFDSADSAMAFKLRWI